MKQVEWTTKVMREHKRKPIKSWVDKDGRLTDEYGRSIQRNSKGNGFQMNEVKR